MSVGYLSLGLSGAKEMLASLDVFMRAMLELGHVKDVSVVLEPRFGEGQNDRLGSLAAELVRLKVDVIVTSSTNATAAAQKATSTIPIVFLNVAYPLKAGFAVSLAHPGHNLTGVTDYSSDLGPKRYQLLKEMVPSLDRVAILGDPRSMSTSLSKEPRRVTYQLKGRRA